MVECWFCKKEEASPNCAEIVKMYGEVKRGDTSNYLVVKTRPVKFKTCEISIPRCKKCKDEGFRSNLIGLVCLVCSVGIAYLITSFGFELTGWFSYVVIAGLTIVSFFLLGFLLEFLLPSRPSITSADYYNYYPPIMEMIRQRWAIGDRPPRD